MDSRNGSAVSKNQVAGRFWTKKRIRAVELLVQDELSDENIAADLHIARSTLSAWKLHPEFAALIRDRADALRAVVRGHGIAVLERRVAAQQARWTALNRIIAERAVDPKMTGVPGGTTGLLQHSALPAGRGEDFRILDVFTLDIGLLRELRELERQVAQELGQWQERHTHSGPGGRGIPLVLSHLSEIDPMELRRQIDEARAYISAGRLPDKP